MNKKQFIEDYKEAFGEGAALPIATRNIGATKASVLGVFEPITAILVGTLVFGEALTDNIIIGIVIATVAVTFMIISLFTPRSPSVSRRTGQYRVPTAYGRSFPQYCHPDAARQEASPPPPQIRAPGLTYR